MVFAVVAQDALHRAVDLGVAAPALLVRHPAAVPQADARGEAEIGFQQISEIVGVPGSELVGPLPPEVQQVTVFSAGVLTNARQPEAAAELIQFLASEEAAETVASTGLDPIKRR